MAQGGLPALVVAPDPRRCAIDVDPLRVHGETGQRHVALPADQPAQAPVGRSVNVERGAVAHTPDHPLGARRHQFATAAKQASVRREEEDGVVDRAATGDPFVDSDDHVGLGPLGYLADRLGVRARHLDCVFQPALEIRVLEGAVAGGHAPDPVGIGRNKCFREDDDIGAAGGSLCDQVDHLRDRCLPIEVGGSRLYRGDLHAATHTRIIAASALASVLMRM